MAASAALYAHHRRRTAADFFISIHHDLIGEAWLLPWNGRPGADPPGVKRGYGIFVSARTRKLATSLRCASTIGAMMRRAGFAPSTWHALQAPAGGCGKRVCVATTWSCSIAPDRRPCCSRPGSSSTVTRAGIARPRAPGAHGRCRWRPASRLACTSGQRNWDSEEYRFWRQRRRTLPHIGLYGSHRPDVIASGAALIDQHQRLFSYMPTRPKPLAQANRPAPISQWRPIAPTIRLRVAEQESGKGGLQKVPRPAAP